MSSPETTTLLTLADRLKFPPATESATSTAGLEVGAVLPRAAQESGQAMTSLTQAALVAWLTAAAAHFDDDAKRTFSDQRYRECTLYAAAIRDAIAALSAAPVPPHGIGCINCHEANDGGYETEDVGPFCSSCWAALNEYYKANPAVPVPLATPQETPQDFIRWAPTQCLCTAFGCRVPMCPLHGESATPPAPTRATT